MTRQHNPQRMRSNTSDSSKNIRDYTLPYTYILLVVDMAHPQTMSRPRTRPNKDSQTFHASLYTPAHIPSCKCIPCDILQRQTRKSLRISPYKRLKRFRYSPCIRAHIHAYKGKTIAHPRTPHHDCPSKLPTTLSKGQSQWLYMPSKLFWSPCFDWRPAAATPCRPLYPSPPPGTPRKTNEDKRRQGENKAPWVSLVLTGTDNVLLFCCCGVL